MIVEVNLEAVKTVITLSSKPQQPRQMIFALSAFRKYLVYLPVILTMVFFKGVFRVLSKISDRTFCENAYGSLHKNTKNEVFH